MVLFYRIFALASMRRFLGNPLLILSNLFRRGFEAEMQSAGRFRIGMLGFVRVKVCQARKSGKMKQKMYSRHSSYGIVFLLNDL
jgi:hypothetical protein